jgi:ethanolamine utilization protein EutN
VKLCRVIGNVVASAKHPVYRGRTLMMVAPEDGSASFLAVDTVQAGPGDRVLVMREGNGVRQILGIGSQVPIRSLIVGIVDDVDQS